MKNNRGNLPMFVVVVVITWLIVWAISSTIVGFMAWCVGSTFTLLNSIIIATVFWLIVVVLVWILAKFVDDNWDM